MIMELLFIYIIKVSQDDDDDDDEVDNWNKLG
jgi:hypothetical protein